MVLFLVRYFGQWDTSFRVCTLLFMHFPELHQLWQLVSDTCWVNVCLSIKLISIVLGALHSFEVTIQVLVEFFSEAQHHNICHVVVDMTSIVINTSNNCHMYSIHEEAN